MKKNRIIYSAIAIVGAAIIAIPTLLNPFRADTSLSTIDSNRTGSITLHKYEQAGEVEGGNTHDGQETANIPEGAKPLKDVEFTIYSLGNNIGTDKYMTTVTEAEAYITENNVQGTAGMTNDKGIVSFGNLALGQYLVKETNSPENVSEKTPPFIVNVPTTVTIDGVDQWLYDIHVYPKNQTIYGSVILDKVDEKQAPLTGATFDLYSETEVDGQTVATLRETRISVNENGQLVVKNLPKGKYHFVETKAPEGYGLNTTPIKFEITASGDVITDNSGRFVPDGENSNTVQLTVVNNKEPNIHKGVKSPTNDYAGYDFGQEHEWVISPDVPADISTYKKYIVTDTLDENLVFSGLDTVRVFINGTWTEDTDDAAGTYTDGTQLTLGKDYTVSYDETTRQLKVLFIDDTFDGGKTALDGATGLYIFFGTTFDETKVSLGTDYPNKAELTYNNGYTDDKEKESETPKVHTGGLSLVKYANDANGTKFLEGAEFRLSKTEEDAKKGNFITDKDGNVITATSDKDGIVKFEGIAYGNDGASADEGSSTYWLVETKSPTVDGVKYNLLKDPVEVVINKTSHLLPDDISVLGNWTYAILNKTGINLPTTGGIGTLLFYLIGGTLIVSAVVAFAKGNKKNKKAN